jgi:hypothetical protein
MNEGKVWWGYGKAKAYLENLGVDGKAILN